MVALLTAVAAVVVFLKKKKSSSQSAKATTTSEEVKEPHQADSKVPELHEDSRPIELSEAVIQELNGQSLQEMEQPVPRTELWTH